MTSFKDLAVVAGTGERGSALVSAVNGRAVPKAGTDDGEELKTSAWLVHEYMLGKARAAGSQEIPGAEPEAVWYAWLGSMTAAIYALELGPASGSDNGNDKASFRRSVNRWLRATGNAVCLRSSHRQPGMPKGEFIQPLWAIRAEFRETPAPAGLPVFRFQASSAGVVSLLQQVSGKPRERRAAGPAPAPAHASASAPASRTGPPQADGVAISVTPSGKLTAGQRDGQIECSRCGNAYAASHLARHFFSQHASASAIATAAVQQRGSMTSGSLMQLLSAASGGAAVASYAVRTALAAAIDAGDITAHRGSGSGSPLTYSWARSSDAAGSAAPAAVTSPPPVQPAASQPAEAAPEPEPESEPERETEPEPAVMAEPAGSDEAVSVEDALASVEEAVSKARFAIAATLRENRSLREYKSRVQQLLGDAE